MKNVVLFSFILLFVLLIFCANRTIKNEESSLQSLYHHVKVNTHSGYEHIWPNIELGWEIIVGTLIGIFGASFGSVGGVGGGGIFVPMLILIIGFDAKSATAISKCMVTGAAISTVFFNLKLRHPTLDIPMIDYDLVLLNQPVIILGISIGVALSVVFADWMITVLLIIIFIVTSVKAFIKGLDTWKKETIVKEEFVKHLESTATSSEDVEYKYLASCPDDEPQKKINQGTILSNIQWKKFGLLCFVWIAVLLLQIAKNYTATCSITYWILTLLQIPVTVGVSMYQAIGLYQGKKITVSKQDHGTHWPLHLLIVSLSCALLAGILGGLLGVGSGFVMGPLFIEFGIAPQVASATATLGMTFTASISVAQYFLLNRFPVPYAFYLSLVATIAAYLGQKVIDKLVNIFQRASLIIFVLSFTVLVSAIALGGVGISHMIEKIQRNEYMGFEDLCLVQVAAITDNPANKVCWWPIYREPDHELVGKIQLSINYTTSADDNSHLKCGSVAETVAYDLVLEVAMKVQGFQQRNLLLDGPWKWLLTEFGSYYGVSEIYTKLRYLSYVMDVATPTADCLNLVYTLLAPVIMKGNSKTSLSHQENRLLGENKEEIEQILSLTFENYKSLDESCLSGIFEVFRPASDRAAPALEPAVKLYKLLHDILSPEAQTAFCHYFQVAAKKRARRHLSDTDEYITQNNEGLLMDHMTITIAYQKMKTLCTNLRNEIYTDIQIHNHNILPSFVDLPNLSASIYSTELCNRLRVFLISCPPTGPSSPVAELLIATSDFQRDISAWNINPIKGGVDAKELFHLYILVWIQDKRQSLLESCKLDKVKWSGVRTQHSTTPFVDDMYERLKETLTDYEVIICRWPEYIMVLENAIADIEKAIVEALDKQYADVLAPLKESMTPKKFGLKYVQKLAKRSTCAYVVPDEVGILLNSLKRMLDTLRPRIESRFKSWGSCLPNAGNTAPGERLSEVTVMLRAKFRNYLQAIVEKLVENTKLQNATKLKKILQESKETVVESDLKGRMQPLKEQLASTISHIHSVCETHVFISICRGYWDRMGQEILSFLENRKENRSWYKGSRVAVSVLDDTFASQMQQLLGNAIQEKDMEAPRCIMEVRSMLCKDAPNHKDNSFYY